MVLNHLAAILLFSGPLFFVGLWMALDPTGIVWLPGALAGVLGNVVRAAAGRREVVRPDHPAIPHRLNTAIRVAGVALLLVAIAF